jgi:hypothetical protein
MPNTRFLINVERTDYLKLILNCSRPEDLFREIQDGFYEYSGYLVGRILVHKGVHVIYKILAVGRSMTEPCKPVLSCVKESGR